MVGLINGDLSWISPFAIVVIRSVLRDSHDRQIRVFKGCFSDSG